MRFWSTFDLTTEASGYRTPEGCDGGHMPFDVQLMKAQQLLNWLCP